MFRGLRGILVMGGLLAALSVSAQDQPLEKRVALSAESLQAANRLAALDRQASLLGSASAVCKFVGWSAPAFPLRAVASLALDSGSIDKWQQLLDEYQKLMDEAGEALVLRGAGGALSGPFTSSIEARRLVHRRIATLPPSILKRYRQSVDARARKLLEEGKSERSPQPLRRLVDEAFCSSVTDQALDVLGDLAFEKGDFEDALAWWRLLALPAGEAAEHGARSERHGASEDLLYPDSALDSARIRAKEVLAYAFMDQTDRARRELAALRALHPLARGELAGASGFYADILAAWIQRRREQAAASNQEPWPTFGGNAARNRALSVCPPARLWVDGPTWRVEWRGTNGAGRDGANTTAPRASPVASRLAYHPVIVDSQVLVADSRSVTGYHLRTGQRLFEWSTGNNDGRAGEARDALLAPRLPSLEGRYTLTAWNHHVFARLGRQGLVAKGTDERDDTSSILVCLNLSGPRPGGLAWKISALRPDNGPAYFEGAPLAAEGRVWAAVSWLMDQRTHTALACFDARSGQRRWWQEVCASAEDGDVMDGRPNEPRKRPHLLTMGGGTLYYCSHAGAILAVDPWTGQCLWGTRYLSRGPRTEEGSPSPRELAPCVYTDGRLYVAPLDSDHLLCLDATNGRLLWESAGMEIVHLLGVARGRVYCTTVRGLQCVSAATGAQTHTGTNATWTQPAAGRLPGLGRGLLAGSWLVWPTQDPKLPYRGVTLDDGSQERFVIDRTAPAEPEYLEPTMLRAILPGNMAFGEGCLVVAGLDELAAYVPQKRFLRERENNLRDASATPLALYQLALAQLDASQTAAARKSVAILEDLIKAPGAADRDNWVGLCSRMKTELGESSSSDWRAASGGWRVATGETAAIRSLLVPRPSPNVPLTLPLQKTSETSSRLAQGSNEVLNLEKIFQGQLRPLSPGVAYSLSRGAPRRPDPYPLTSFQRNTRLVFFLVDERLLVAMDPMSGKLAWRYWAPGGQIRPLADGGRFNPHYHADDSFVLLQTTAGKCLALDSQTGKLISETRATQAWPTAPLPLGEGRFALAGEYSQVELLDVLAGAIVWRYRPDGSSSLSGAPSHVFGDQDNLLALIARNIGTELVRLDPARGTLLWSIPFLSGAFDAQMASLDRAAVYFATSNTLQARSLKDGHLLWRATLPGDFRRWQTLRTASCLLAYPQVDVALPKLPLSLPPFSLPIPLPLGSAPPESRALLVIDPRTGQWMQRLALTDGPGTLAVRVEHNCLTIFAGGKTSVYRGPRD